MGHWGPSALNSTKGGVALLSINTWNKHTNPMADFMGSIRASSPLRPESGSHTYHGGHLRGVEVVDA